jgi:hypothetical protein
MEINNKLFKHHILNIFCEIYNVNKERIVHNNHSYFRYLCFKYNYFIKHITIPKIKKKSNYEAVLIEFRNFPHIEFIVRNAIIQLGENWSHTIVCGNHNYEMVVNICRQLSNHINIIKINVDNKSQSEYSKMLTTSDFWNRFNGEKILIYQEDSLIFKKNINDFLSFDFIGAPFPKHVNDTPNLVGNGGLSLRSKSKMLEVIETISLEETVFNSSTLDYMKKVNLTVPPEDIYFSKNMQELNIGKVADWDSAYQFSTESINNPNSFAGHKFWISDKKWKDRLKNMFQFSEYQFRNDIVDYLKYNNMPKNFDKTKTIKNAFDIDLYFFSKVNNFPYSNNNKEILKHIKNIGLHGYLYHPKQLINIFPEICFYSFLDNIYVFHKLNIYTIQDFASKFLYNLSYDDLCSRLIKKKFCTFDKDIDVLLLVFIGNEDRGMELINSIIEYKKIQKFNVSFCFNSDHLFSSEKIKKKIKEHFKNYAIYISNELGTDITPTLLMYNEIIKNNHFNHIIKLHTKSITNQYNDLTNYLLKKPISSLILEKKSNCNCIGHPDYYMDLYEDIFNNDLKIKYASEIDSTRLFVAGTIFYASGKTLDSVIDIIKKTNYRSFFLNNLYENNTINRDFSPIHFLERLFGVLRV